MRPTHFTIRSAPAWLCLLLLASSLLDSSAGAPAESLSQPTPSAALAKPAPGPMRALPQVFAKPVPDSTADLQAIEQHVKNLAPKVAQAVVSVEVGGSTGSGVVITSGGLILTAGHVAGRANRSARITFPDGKVVRGKTLGANDESDCGIIQITEPGSWPRAQVADSTLPRLGAWVLALGHPGGYDSERPSVVRLGRIVRVTPTTVQTDCTITTGDSGGPLFDMHGRVVGIHSYVSNSMTDNYHIPLLQFYEEWSSLTQAETRTQAAGLQPEIHAAR